MTFPLISSKGEKTRFNFKSSSHFSSRVFLILPQTVLAPLSLIQIVLKINWFTEAAHFLPINVCQCFDRVHLQLIIKILLDKLAYYGIRGVANDWFKSYLSNRQQYVSINGHHSSNVVMKQGVPQSSVLGPLLFLIYINDLHKSIKYCNVGYFADDTNLLISDNSPKQIQHHVNLDLKHQCRWLRANKISLNKSKLNI